MFSTKLPNVTRDVGMAADTINPAALPGSVTHCFCNSLLTDFSAASLPLHCPMPTTQTCVPRWCYVYTTTFILLEMDSLRQFWRAGNQQHADTHLADISNNKLAFFVRQTVI